MILGGQNISGDDALQIGLVDHVVSAADFFKEIDNVADGYMAACSVGTRMSKLATNKAFDLDFEAFLKYYYELQQRAQYSADAEEAKSAYLEKRTPIWQ